MRRIVRTTKVESHYRIIPIGEKGTKEVSEIYILPQSPIALIKES
jgi:hypothetical protein